MAKKSSRLERIRAGAQAFLDGPDYKSEHELSRGHKFIHFWVLVGKSFVRNRCPIQASALSFTTLLALIPMLAVVLSVTSSLLKKEGEDRIYHFIDRMVSNVVPSIGTNVPPATASSSTNAIASAPETNGAADMSPAATNEVLAANSSSATETNAAARSDSDASAAAAAARNERVEAQKEAAKRIREFIQNTRSRTLGVTGVILLIVVAIRMLASVESTFNDIWGVTRGRNWFVRTVVYWAAVTLGPMLLIAALGLTSGSFMVATKRFVMDVPIVGHMVFPALTLLVLWFGFALFYKAVPNTKVNFDAALVGALVGATAWHLNNLFSFLTVSRFVSNSRIYGSMALVPVFMVGLYFSWLIVLFGAQVAYAYQNRALYLQEKIAENVNQRGREFVALRLMTCIGQRFDRGLTPPTIQEISTELGIPSRLVQQVLQTLMAAHLVIEVAGVEPAYTPARPLDKINAHHLLQAMRAALGQELVTRDEPVREEVYGEFARIQEAEKQAASSVSVLALVHRAQARLELAPPPTAEEEIKLTPALVPVIPVERPEERAIDLPTGHAPEVDSPPTNPSAATSPPSHSPAEDERDFPL
jgi:membrane protein